MPNNYKAQASETQGDQPPQYEPARELLAGGYEPIPVAGKRPVSDGWQAGDLNEDRVKAEFEAHQDACNIGLRTGRLVGVDIDVEDPAEAERVKALVETELGATPFVRVGKKGMLLCYRNPEPARKITAASADRTKVEILGQGQQFVAYGLHPDTGRPYRWTTGAEPALMPFDTLPAVTTAQLRALAPKLRDLLGDAHPDVKATGDLERAEPGQVLKFPAKSDLPPFPSDELEARLFCCTPVCTRDDWRDLAAALHATPCADLEFDKRSLFVRWSMQAAHLYPDLPEAAEEIYDSMAPKPGGLGAGSFVRLTDAAGYTGPTVTRPPRLSTLETFAEYLGRLGVEQTAPANDTVTGPVPFGDLMGREVPPVQWLIDGLVERGTVTFFAGHGGTHKSRVALQWGLSISAGQDVFGRRVEPARFLYLSYEDHPDEVARRTQKIAQRLGLPAGLDQADYWDLTGQDAPLAVIRESGEVETRRHWGLLRDRLSAMHGHKFVVIDSTYNALRFEGAAKINEGAVMAGIGALQRLCLETNSTIVCLWHPSQAGQERGDNSGWSVAWHNGPRARISLTADRDRPDTFELKVEKQNHGPKGAPVTLHWADGVLLPRTSASGEDYATRLEDACVVAALAAAEQGMPLQKQRRPFKWVFDEVEQACGHRPTAAEVKEILASALHHGKLRYVAGSKDRTAGYYPPDIARASELAHEAKAKAAEAG